MSQRAKFKNQWNHSRQKRYLSEGIVMLPTLREERRAARMTKKSESNN